MSKLHGLAHQGQAIWFDYIRLIGPNTVNTLPPATLQAFLDHGQVASSLEEATEEAVAHLSRLVERGVDLGARSPKSYKSTEWPPLRSPSRD